MRRAISGVLGGLLTISTFLGALAQEPGPGQRPGGPARRQGAPRGQARPAEPEKKDASTPGPREAAEAKPKGREADDEKPVITHHKITIGGEDLKYTATAGLMPIRDAKGDTEARIFFMAYTRDDAGPSAKRPLLFSFNGGPGSSSVWLHLGTLGPKRVPTTDAPTIPAPPFTLIDNDATWLDRADLVFIDPVGTGYSRASKPELNQKFHSLRGDIESVGEFIRMYLTRSDRWDSPLFLIGESYGTTRAAGLSGHLIDQGIALNGVILVSCALDFQDFSFTPGNDQPYLHFLPSYAASAWYHKKLPPDLQKLALKDLLKQVEEWIDREYASILSRGDRITEDERKKAAEQLARFTGLKADAIDDRDLRIGMGYFSRELLRSEHRSIGRYDARYKGIENRSPNDGRGPSHDPSYDAVQAAYTSTFNHYIRDELGYKVDMPYHVLGGIVGRWDFQTERGYPSTTSQLRDAMTQNPHMKVMIASGYFDLATPYRAVEHALAGLGLDPSLRPNISIEYFEAGHMMYLHTPSLHELKRDGAAFLERATGKR